MPLDDKEGPDLTKVVVMRYIDYFIWLIGAEALIYCIMMLLSAHWGNKLIIYLQKNHSQFYKEYLDVPFLAGGPDVMRKHYKALKIAYWGNMPDELSNTYRNYMKFYAKISLFCLLILFITIAVIILKIGAAIV